MNRTLPVLLALTLLLPALGVRTALGQEPQRLTSPITDDANVLDERLLEPLLESFQQATGSQLHVLFLETTGTAPIAVYVEETIALNNFGAGDALFVVAVDDRAYQLWIGDRLASSITVDEQDDVLIDDVEPHLASGDYNEAVRALGNGLAVAATGAPLALTPVPAPGEAPADGTGTGPNIFVVFAVLAAVVAAIWGGMKVFRRFRPAPARVKPAAPANLAERANEVLLEADEALRDVRQEVSFAEAEFGPDAVRASNTALSEAEGKLNEAFRIRQQLDDDVKETPAEREAMLQSLIAACESVLQISERESNRADELRDLERRAEAVVADLPSQIEDTARRVATASTDYNFLRANAPGAAREVEGNVVEAEKCVDFANDEADVARESLGAGETVPAAPSIRAAQAALAEADRLAKAISDLRASVNEARAALAGDLRSAEAAINSARRASNAAGASLTALAEAERMLIEARELAGGDNADPIAARARAIEAKTVADNAMAAARSEQERQQQLASTAASSVASAQAAFDRAEDYIQSRRLGVGSTARTRIAEAKRHLAEARRVERSDPGRAASEAQRASRLAEEALRHASRDFASYDQPPARRPSSLPGSRAVRSGGDISSAGAVLADILGAGVDGSRWGTPRQAPRATGSRPGGRSSAGSFSVPGLHKPSGSASRPQGGGGRSRGGRW